MLLDFCCACGGTEHLQYHHMVPKSKGGGDEESNMLTLCYLCHGKIHGRTFHNHSKLTAAAMAHKKAKGERVGTIPYGWLLADDGVQLVESPEEQAILKRIELLNAQGLSLSAIARTLESEGVETKKGGKWHPQTIKNLLKATA